MRMIDHLRRNPMCWNGDTQKMDFDASEMLNAKVFLCSEIVEQVVESSTDMPDGGKGTTFTPFGQDLLKMVKTDDGYRIKMQEYVGLVPPFESCWFEWPTLYDPRSTDCGVHLFSLPKEEIQRRFPDQDFGFVMLANVFQRLDIGVIARETVAIIYAGPEGRMMSLKIKVCLPPGADLTLPANAPAKAPLLILMLALMLLNAGYLKKTLSPEVPKSRQQRRYDERHPERATMPLVQYYTLNIDLNKTHPNGEGTVAAGYTKAWHEVRGHKRNLKSGRSVPVKAHGRGDPFKAVIHKRDYKLKMPPPSNTN
jgi:hypothetical protein